MRREIENRLQSLIAEFKAGQEMAVELEARQVNLKMTMARISGAIQVLEELLRQDETNEQPSDSASSSTTPMAA